MMQCAIDGDHAPSLDKKKQAVAFRLQTSTFGGRIVGPVVRVNMCRYCAALFVESDPTPTAPEKEGEK
jgi:hypothetical protein